MGAQIENKSIKNEVRKSMRKRTIEIQKFNRRKCGRLYITKVRQRAPKGSYLELKRRLKGAKRDPKRVKRQPKCIKKLKSERCRQKGRPQGGTIRSFGSNYGTFFFKKTMNKSMHKSMSKKYGHL